MMQINRNSYKIVILFQILILLSISCDDTSETGNPGSVIYVPSEQPTIQAGIDVASDGDTVLVDIGSYVENINYHGKNIVVGSQFLTTDDTSYISQTIIDGDHNGTVITFNSGEDSTAIFCGFTLINGQGYDLEEAGHNFSAGGITCWESSPSISNVIIKENTAHAYGGGISFYESNSKVENTTISDNSAGTGGGIYCASSSPSLLKVLIIDNTANQGGGIVCTTGSNPGLEYVTISNNSADYYSGGVFCINSQLSLTNSILWNDSPNEIYIESSSVTISFSDIQGGWVGEGNIDSNPFFCNSDNGDYSLAENSPCVGTGENSVDMSALSVNCGPH
ncbi:MAG: hypothetical protein HQ510_03380 [Candidatus Marinimicrobia bacterium]|nr:hypothetical protein [Candidatus Neomarinimicrobiota bacterium]